MTSNNNVESAITTVESTVDGSFGNAAPLTLEQRVSSLEAGLRELARGADNLRAQSANSDAYLKVMISNTNSLAHQTGNHVSILDKDLRLQAKYANMNSKDIVALEVKVESLEAAVSQRPTGVQVNSAISSVYTTMLNLSDNTKSRLSALEAIVLPKDEEKETDKE